MTPYTSKFAKNMFLYTVQDAIDICQLSIDLSRRLARFLDFKQIISDDEEILVITIDGIQWIKKAKLEVK